MLSLAAPTSALAATRIWSGAGPDDNWSTGANWVGGVAPSAGDDLVFPSNPSTFTATNDFPAGTEFRTITFAGSGYTLDGNAIDLESGLITTTIGSNASGENVINLDVRLIGDERFETNLAGSTLTIRGAITMNGGALDLAGSGRINLDGAISGLGSIAKLDNGVAVLSADNAGFAGIVAVQAGTLRIAHGNALGSPTITTGVADGATLETVGSLTVAERISLRGAGVGGGGALVCTGATTGAAGLVWSGPISLDTSSTVIGVASDSTLTITGVISGSGGPTLVGGGALRLTASNTYTGDTRIENGAVNLLLNSALGATSAPTTVLANGRVVLVGDRTIAEPLIVEEAGTSPALSDLGDSSWTGPITLNAAGVEIDGGLLGDPLLLVGAISGPGGPEYSGSVIVAGGSPNTYTGATTIVGAVRAAKATAFGSVAAGTTVASNGVLEMDDGLTSAEPLTLAGDGPTGQGALIGGGQWSGPIALAAGGATIGVETGRSIALSGAISGSGGLSKVGAGQLVLSGTGSNTYSGATTVTAGTLAPIKTGTAVAIPGPLTIGTGSGAAESVVVGMSALGGTNQIANGATVTLDRTGLLALNDRDETVGGLSFAGGIVRTDAPGGGVGLLTIQGDVSTSGPTVAGGQGRIEGRVSLGGTTRTFTVSDAAHQLISLASIENGALTKAGPGQLQLSGLNLYTGATTISAGRLVITGLQPQSPIVMNGGSLGGLNSVIGTITATGGAIDLAAGTFTGAVTTGGLSLSGGTTYDVAVRSPSEHDKLTVNGPVSLGGAQLVVRPNSAQNVGDSFRIIDNDGSDAVVGTFAGLPEGGIVIGDGQRFRVTYVGGTGNDVVLTRVPDPCAPRPNVSLSTQPEGPGRLRVTVTAGTNLGTLDNRLVRIELQPGSNALVDAGNQTGLSGHVTLPVANRPASTSFVLRRATPGQAVHLPFVVVDDCGDWTTFVGGGPAAF